MRNVCLALIILACLPVTLWAADLYSVNSGATAEINEHGVCQRITNGHTSGQRIMVPTKTASEWTTFRNNRPSGVGMAACPPACSGHLISGYCWYGSALNESCTTVCSSRGGVDLIGTRSFAGSGGSLGNCQIVGQALWGSGGAANQSSNYGTNDYGCTKLGVFNTTLRFTYAATTAGSASAMHQRACACNN